MHRMILATATLALAGLFINGSAQAETPVRDLAQARPGTYKLDPDHGKITWSVSHLGFSTYVGQFTDVSATLVLDPQKIPASRLDAQVNMASVASLNTALDEHLKAPDFFDVARYPIATLRATQIRIISANTAEITGELTLRGVTRPLVITADFNQAGKGPADGRYTLGFDGRGRIKRSEFGIAYGLPVLGDEVTLHFEAEFKLQAGAGES